MRDYQFVSPSLDGIIRHDSIMYEGIHRSETLMRVMDRRFGTPVTDATERKVLEQYQNDIYTVFMKKLTSFVASGGSDTHEGVKIQALLQELIKVKQLIARV